MHEFIDIQGLRNVALFHLIHALMFNEGIIEWNMNIGLVTEASERNDDGFSLLVHRHVTRQAGQLSYLYN